MAEKISSSRFVTQAYSFLRLAFICGIRVSRRRLACTFVRFTFLCRSSSVCSRSLTEKPTLSKNCFKALRPSNSTLNGERRFSCCTEISAARRNLHGATRNCPSLPFVPGINSTADVKDDSFFIYDHGSYHGNDQDEGAADENRLVSYMDAYGCSWEEEDVDRKADEFIAQFRKQLELEQKMSFLRFEEMQDDDDNNLSFPLNPLEESIG